MYYRLLVSEALIDEATTTQQTPNGFKIQGKYNKGKSRKGNIIQTLRGALFLAGVVVAAHLPGPMSTPLLPPATKNHSKPRVGLAVLPPPFPPLQTRPALIFQ